MALCGISVQTAILANVIAKDMTGDELEMAAAVFTQLGDTLTTIGLERACCKNDRNDSQ